MYTVGGYEQLTPTKMVGMAKFIWATLLDIQNFFKFSHYEYTMPKISDNFILDILVRKEV